MDTDISKTYKEQVNHFFGEALHLLNVCFICAICGLLQNLGDTKQIDGQDLRPLESLERI